MVVTIVSSIVYLYLKQDLFKSMFYGQNQRTKRNRLADAN